MLASAVLLDMKMVSPNERSKVIDRSKIRRERTKVRKALAAAINEIEGLYFDGRKDKTMHIVRCVDKKYHRKKVVEEHASIISEPGSLYSSQVVPYEGTSNAITQAILDYLEEKNVDLAEIKVIGCDGTNVNTGHARGVIRRLEVSLQRPLQWLVCLLHSNELPLRHLFLHLDGATTGPLGFYGPIGKALNSCVELAVVAFEPVQLSQPLPAVDLGDISTDQQYMRVMCGAVDKADCSVDLALQNPGLLNHSRWLTTNRILRLSQYGGLIGDTIL